MANQPTPPSDDHAAAITAAFILAEQQILGGASRILRANPATRAGILTSLGQLRDLVRRVLAGLARTPDQAAAMVSAATAEGRAAAGREIAASRALVKASAGVGGSGGITLPPGRGLDRPEQPFDLSMPHGERAAQAIRDDVVSSLEDVRRRITRLPDDIYKAIAPHGAIGQVLDNELTPAQAQAAAWRVFTQHGVTGFVDRSGRNWSMSAYVEMAVRTASARAFNDSHLQTMRAVGIQYFTVPAHGSPCPLCWPWQGSVLTEGDNPNPDVHTDGTIQDAIARGLFHPNCRHVLAPYFPGVTVLHEQEPWGPEQQAEYDASQKQRALERDIRRAKQDAEHALTPDARQKALTDVRRAQARMRAFIDATGRLRQSRREQVDLANDHIKIPIPR